MYDALLFDLDGTLIDTESIALATGLAAFAAAGHSVDEAFMHRLVGRDEPTAAGIIRAAIPEADLEMINRSWRAAFSAGVDRGLPLKPGAAELLGLARQPLAIVTSTGREGAHRRDCRGLRPCRHAGRRDRPETRAGPVPAGRLAVRL
jgi:beta-phosphoglucomutase-like phosphatase (HAD superfamily)